MLALYQLPISSSYFLLWQLAMQVSSVLIHLFEKYMKVGFYAVVGNSDYCTIENRKIPIWEMLEYQPTGWLCSLSTHPEVMPPEHYPRIWDCGAYSYKDQDFPTINNKYVDAHYAIYRYKERSNPGDIIVSPDQLLIGNNINLRRQFNIENATTFIELAAASLPDRVPMATVHGNTLQERIEMALLLYKLGYRAIAIGSLVPSANDYSGTIKIVRAIVEAIRNTNVHVHIHVFGLCAPRYARVFYELGLSFDGSTHARKAFTARTVLMRVQSRLVRYPASPKGRKPIAPQCNCRVCNMLQKHGIDPRYYDISRANDMARCAHNLNALLAMHHHAASRKTIYLISGCGKQLHSPSSAKDLYCSQHFRTRRNFVELMGQEWFILSPLHQVVNPDSIIEPYDKSPYSMGEKERKLWANQVAQKLMELAPNGSEFVFLTGKHYRCHVIPLLQARGYVARTPMQGLGIGLQLAWLKRHSHTVQMALPI